MLLFYTGTIHGHWRDVSTDMRFTTQKPLSGKKTLVATLANVPMFFATNVRILASLLGKNLTSANPQPLWTLHTTVKL